MRVVIAESPRLCSGLDEVRHRWTFAELIEAHATLDAIEALRPDPPVGR